MIIAPDPSACMGEVVDNGHCMRHVQVVAGVPHSSELRKGAKVRGTALIPVGTIIATFDATGCYANATDGSSHIAIYLGQDEEGIEVTDQWVGQPVHERFIRFKGGQGPACDDGDQFFVVKTE